MRAASGLGFSESFFGVGHAYFVIKCSCNLVRSEKWRDYYNLPLHQKAKDALAVGAAFCSRSLFNAKISTPADEAQYNPDSISL
jgi:hypothetical protein